jgi:hypothetical protein
LPVWLRSELGYSKYQYFIKSGIESDADSTTYTYAHSDPNSYSEPDSDSHSDPNAYADTNTHAKHARPGRVGTRREPRL